MNPIKSQSAAVAGSDDNERLRTLLDNLEGTSDQDFLAHLMHAKHELKANFCETRSSVSARVSSATMYDVDGQGGWGLIQFGPLLNESLHCYRPPRLAAFFMLPGNARAFAAAAPAAWRC
jgi:hypothetical protein